MNKISKKQFFKVILTACFFGLFIVFASININNQNKTAQERINIFNESIINGRITHLSSSHGFSFFKVDNNETTYMFYPLHGENKKSFLSNAEIGDIVIKEENKTYINLIKDGDIVYQYPLSTRIHKINENLFQ